MVETPTMTMPGSPPAQYQRDMYSYQVQFAALAAGATADGAIQIQADSAFQWVAGVFSARVPTTPDYTWLTSPLPPISVLITDTGSGRQLSNRQVPLANYFGTAQLPFILPVSRIFKPNSVIQFRVSVDAASEDAWDLFLTLHGAKIFNYNTQKA